jgi:hypothetical protein
MSAKQKMRVSFFYSDRDVYETAKVLKVYKPDEIRLAPSHEATNEKAMVDWANKFYEKYGYELDFMPNSGVGTQTDKFILQKKDGIRPRVFDQASHDKFEREFNDLIGKRKQIPKDKIKEIQEADKKIEEAGSRVRTTLYDYLQDIQKLRLKCDENFIGGNVFGITE